MLLTARADDTARLIEREANELMRLLLARVSIGIHKQPIVYGAPTKTAEKLGLTVPPVLLAIADKVIE